MPNQPRYISSRGSAPEPRLLASPGGAGGESESLDLREIFTAVRRRLWLVLALIAVGTGGAVFVARRSKPVYKATAVIRLADVRGQLAGNIGALTGEISRSATVDPLLSQIQILSSRAVASHVVDSIPGLRVRSKNIRGRFIDRVHVDDAGYADSLSIVFSGRGYILRSREKEAAADYGEPAKMSGVTLTVTKRPPVDSGVVHIGSRDDGVQRLLGNLDVHQREQTDVIDVTYADPDPTTAQRVVNAVVQTFQSSNAAAAQQQSKLRRRFLEEQLHQNDSLLRSAEQSLSAFRSGQQLYSSKDKLTAEQVGIGAAQARREELDAERRMLRAALTEVGRPDASDEALGALVTLPGASSSPVITQLYGRLSALHAAKDSLTAGPWGAAESNPDVGRLNLLLTDVLGKIAAAARSVITAYDARIRALDDVQAHSAASFQNVSSNEAEEARLVQQADAIRKISDQLRDDYQKARIAEAVEVGQVEIVDAAIYPEVATGPSRIRTVILGGLLGALLGIGLTLLLEHLNGSIRRREEIEVKLRLPGLAVIPQSVLPRWGGMRRLMGSSDNGRDNSRGSSSGLIVVGQVQSGAAEAYRQLRTSLLFADVSKTLRSLVVSSPHPGDGKSTVAANLAAVFAQQSLRVLLVDADLRRGRLDTMFHVRRSPGMTDLLRGTASIAECVLATDVEGLSLLPTGANVESPADLLALPALGELLLRLRDEFDLVVIDSPPVLVAADASLLASKADAAVLVVRAGQTEPTSAQYSLQHLASVGARVLGAVLNDPNSSMVGYRGDYYRSYYHADR